MARAPPAFWHGRTYRDFPDRAAVAALSAASDDAAVHPRPDAGAERDRGRDPTPSSIYQEKYHPIVTWPSFVANLFLVQAWNILPYLTLERRELVRQRRVPALPAVPGLYRAVARRLGERRRPDRGGHGGPRLSFFTGKHGLDITFHNGIFRGMGAFAVGVGLCGLYGKTRPFAERLPEAAISAFQLAVLALVGLRHLRQWLVAYGARTSTPSRRCSRWSTPSASTAAS
ncbi:MAG: hypothetical protein WDM86_15175 [Rhizomicrobium sp.]